jgi:hypothetical protein
LRDRFREYLLAKLATPIESRECGQTPSQHDRLCITSQHPEESFPVRLALELLPKLAQSGSFVILVNFQTEDSELVLVFTGSAFTNLA